MLSLALVFLMATIGAAFLSLSGVLPAAEILVQTIFYISLIGFVVSLINHLANMCPRRFASASGSRVPADPDGTVSRP